MKQYLNKNHYDLYEFDFKELKKNSKDKIEKLIYNQLLRIHPCFSNDYLYDCFIIFKLRKIIVVVIVVHSNILSNYNQKKYIKYNKKSIQIFKTKNNNLKFWGIFLIIFLLSIFLNYFYIYKKNNNLKTPQIIETLDVHCQLKSVLEILIDYKNNFTLNNFSYQIEDNLELINLSLSDLNIEKLRDMINDLSQIKKINFSFDEITYINNKALINLDINSNFQIKKDNYVEYNLLRNDICKNNGILRKEENSKIFFSISCNNLKTLIEELLNKNLCIHEISIQKKSLKYDVSLKVFQCKNLICLENKKAILLLNHILINEDSTHIESIEDLNDISLVKIGQSLNAKGQLVEYFKNSQGKIILKENWRIK